MRKTCFKCGVEKDLSDYYAHKRMADGHLNKCKDCAKKDVNERYEIKRDVIAEYEKKRFQTSARKQKVLEYQRNRRQQYPEKSRAYKQVYLAVKSGKLKKLPCEICGSEEKVQAHHHKGYSEEFALDVQWLCFECHREHGHGQKCNKGT